MTRKDYEFLSYYFGLLKKRVNKLNEKNEEKKGVCNDYRNALWDVQNETDALLLEISANVK